MLCVVCTRIASMLSMSLTIVRVGLVCIYGRFLSFVISPAPWNECGICISKFLSHARFDQGLEFPPTSAFTPTSIIRHLWKGFSPCANTCEFIFLPCPIKHEGTFLIGKRL